MHERLSHNPARVARKAAKVSAAGKTQRSDIGRVQELADPIEIATRALWPHGVPYNRVQEVAQWQRDTAKLLEG